MKMKTKITTTFKTICKFLTVTFPNHDKPARSYKEILNSENSDGESPSEKMSHALQEQLNKISTRN
jgi:hypothetical protein